MSVCCCCCF